MKPQSELSFLGLHSMNLSDFLHDELFRVIV